MPITHAALTNGTSSTDATSYATASITPTANRLVLAAVRSRVSSGTPNTPSASGNGLTWTLINSIGVGTRKEFLFRALGASPSAGAVTFDFGAQTQEAAVWIVSEFAGVNTSAPVTQSATNTGASVTTLTVTLGTFADVGNATFGVFGSTASGGGDVTPGSGFTEIADIGIGAGSFISLQTEWRDNNDTSVDISSGTARNREGIAIEIAASGSPPEPPPPSGSRDPFEWPFDTFDPWNYPIGTGAVYTATSGVTFSSMGIAPQRWSTRVYQAAATDPLRTVTNIGSHPSMLDPDTCVNSGTGASAQIRIPDSAIEPDPTTDGHTSFVDENKQFVHELYKANELANGNWECTGLAKNDVRNKGSAFSCFHGTRAYGGSNMGGLIRAGEFANGIKHAVLFGISTTVNKQGKIWPASSSDGAATTTNVGTSSLLAIPASVDVSALGLTTAQGTALATALQKYGGYVCTQGSMSAGHIQMYVEVNAESEAPRTAAFTADTALIAAQLKIVSNNGPNSIGGGGTPLTSFAPPFGTATANAPAAVTSLAAGTITDTTIPLTWTNNDGANNDTATSTEVWWKRSVDTVYTKITLLAAGLASYTLNPPLAASTGYNVQAYKRNATGLSNSSNTLTATTTPAPAPPTAPSGAVLVAESYDRVTLTWVDNSANETAFVREVSKNFGAWASAGADLAANTTSTTYADPSPGDGGNTYQMRVAAKNANGTSAFATSDSVTTPPKAVPAANVTSDFAPSTSSLGEWPKTTSTDDTARRLIAIEPIFAPAPYKNLTVLQTEVLSALTAAKENALYQTIASLTEMWFYVTFALDSAFAGPAGDFVTIAQLHDDVAGKILAALRVSGTGNTLQLNSEATGATFPQTVAAALSAGASHTVEIRVKTGAAGIIEVSLDDTQILNLTALDMTGWVIKQLRIGGVRVPASWTGKWWYKTVRLSDQDIVVTTTAVQSQFLSSPTFLGGPTFQSSPTFPS